MLKNKLQIQIEVKAIIPVMRTNTKQKEETASKISRNDQLKIYYILCTMR